MKKIIVLALLFWIQFNFAQEKKELIFFEYNKYELSKPSIELLNKLVKEINFSEIEKIEINGNTDSDGNTNFNKDLSEKRAQTVTNYLIEKNIPSSLIIFTASGEENPSVNNANEREKYKNRRVEINFITKVFDNTIFDKISKESQFFDGIPNENIIIKGNQGTVISIPKNSLLKQNNKYPTGKIDFELQEYYKKSDIIIGNLHSMSGKEMLETGGMIYFKATYKGEELKLKKNSKATVEFSSKNNPDDMEVFYGYKKDKSIDWNTNVDYNNNNEIEFQITDITYLLEEESKTIIDTISIKTRTYKSFQRDTLSTRKLNILDKTILNIAKLGWINCDRFYDVKEKTDIIVNTDFKYKPEIRLVFTDINSIMSSYINEKDDCILNNIPIGKKATLIAFSYVNNETYLDMKEIVVSKDLKLNLNLKKITLDDFKSEIVKLN